MTRLRTYLGAALVGGALLATTAAGCGSDGSSNSKPLPGQTLVVVGTTNETVNCVEKAYNYALGGLDPEGSGISVIHGVVRGSMKVWCTGGSPDSYYIQVILVRDGVMLNPGSPYEGIPNVVGYEAWTIVKCIPGTYQVHYLYKWTLSGAAVTNKTKTMTEPRVVTQNDCDKS